MILDQPVVLADRILTSVYLPGVGITVSVKQIQSGPPAYEISATAGQSTETQRHTFGNDAGTGPMPNTLQAWLDARRQDTADAAAWDEHVRLTPVT